MLRERYIGSRFGGVLQEKKVRVEISKVKKTILKDILRILYIRKSEQCLYLKKVVIFFQNHFRKSHIKAIIYMYE